MRIIYVVRLIILLFPYFIISQVSILCPEQEFTVWIQNENDIPTVTDNMDGTITLTSTEQYITDIFASREIYDFQRTYPTATSAPVNQYYDIFCKSKDLINELYDVVPSDVFFFDRNFTGTSINADVINFLDGKTFYFKSWCYDNNPMLETICPEDETNIPEGFNLLVPFSYDVENNLLYMNSDGLTPLGNSFNIAFKGGENSLSLQLWESTPQTVQTYTVPYPENFSLENDLFNLLGVGCENTYYGDIFPQITHEDQTITLIRENSLMFTSHFKFQDYSLSIEENNFETNQLINNKNNPFINFTNIENGNYLIEIYSILGNRILDKIPFKNNTISISNLSSGLHFIKLTNSKNQSKVFKLIN